MGQQKSKLLCSCCGCGGRKKGRRKRRRRLHYDEIYQPSDLSEWEKIKDKEISIAASRDPVVNIEVQAHCTESKGSISTKLVEITSKSVGLIIGHLTSGTGFRVGEKYIMTSLHIVKGICNFGGMFKESNLESPDVYICFNYSIAYDTDRLIFHFVGKIRYANEELDVAILELKINDDKILPPRIPCCINFQYGIDPGFHLIGQSYKDPNKIIEKNIQLWTKNAEIIKKAQTWSMDMFNENGYLGLNDPKRELCSCNYQLSMDGAPGIVTLRQKPEPIDFSGCQIDLHIATGDDNLQPIHQNEFAVSVELFGNERLLRCMDSRFEPTISDDEADSDNEITYVKMVNAKCDDDMPVESSHTNYSGHESSLVCSDDSIKYSSHLVKVESHEKIDICPTHENLFMKHCIDGSGKNVEESLEENMRDCCSSPIVIDDRKCVNLESLDANQEVCYPCNETDDMKYVKESRNYKLNMRESTREEIYLQREKTLITKTESSSREKITTQREITPIIKTGSSVTDTRDVFLDKTCKNERRNSLKKTEYEENTFSIQNEDKELISELKDSSDMSCPAVGFVCDDPLVVQELQGEDNLDGEVSPLIHVPIHLCTVEGEVSPLIDEPTHLCTVEDEVSPLIDVPTHLCTVKGEVSPLIYEPTYLCTVEGEVSPLIDEPTYFCTVEDEVSPLIDEATYLCTVEGEVLPLIDEPSYLCTVEDEVSPLIDEPTYLCTVEDEVSPLIDEPTYLCTVEGEVSPLLSVPTYAVYDHFTSDDGYQSISKGESFFLKDDSTSITNSEDINMSENEGLILTTKESDLEMSNPMDSTNICMHLENKHSKQFNINCDHVEIGNNNVVLTEKDATHEICCDTVTTASDIHVNALIKAEVKTDISHDTLNQSDKANISLETFNQWDDCIHFESETDSYNNFGICYFNVNSVSSKESEYSFVNHNCIEVSEVLERNDDDENEISKLSSCNSFQMFSDEHPERKLEKTVVYEPDIVLEKTDNDDENQIEKLSSCNSSQKLSDEHRERKLEKTVVYEPDIVLEKTGNDDENQIEKLSSCNSSQMLSDEHWERKFEKTVVYGPDIVLEKTGNDDENQIEKLSSCNSSQMLSDEHRERKLEKTIVYEPDIVLKKTDNDDENEIEKLSSCNSTRTLSDDHEHLGQILEEMVVYEPGVVIMLLRGYPTFYYRDGTSNETKELVTEDKLINTVVTMKSVFDDMKQYNIYRELCSDIFVTDIIDTVKENRRIFYESDLPPVNL